jgi:hypothetical protein
MIGQATPLLESLFSPKHGYRIKGYGSSIEPLIEIGNQEPEHKLLRFADI